MGLRVEPDLPLSPSRQLVEAVLDRVAAGGWGAGDRLPSVRDAAAEALVNPNTIARAWRELEAMGVVVGRAGDGVFVTEGGPEIARRDRRKATLAALRRAAEEAVRSGHSPETVVEEAEKAARGVRPSRAKAAKERGGGR